MTTMKIQITPEMRIRLMHAETIEIDVPDTQAEQPPHAAGKAAILACADHFEAAWASGFVDRPQQDMLDVTTAIRNFAETYQGAGS
jgi:hypothetical protein